VSEKRLTDQDQLKEHCEKNNFQIIGNVNIVEKDIHEASNLVEYKINISPENLDSILKLTRSYAYRDEGSLLKLCKNLKYHLLRSPLQHLL
jgi:hypothetical protein